jgi:hypothetical protein
MVLCENCHQYWHDRRAVLDGALAAISADPDLLDHVIGYARAIACEINAAQEPRADYMELGAAGEDIGIADRYGLTVGEVRAACRNEADDLCLGVSTSDLQKLDPRRSRV